MQQEALVAVLLDDDLVDDLNQHRAEVSLLVVEAATLQLVEPVKRHLEHDLFQELLRVAELVVALFETPLLVKPFDFGQLGALVN